MKIYRFFPDTGRYSLAGVSPWATQRWWPEGMTVPGGKAKELLDRDGDRPWEHEGNRYRRVEPDRPFSDFPLLALNVPVASIRAAEALRGHVRGIVREVPIHIGEAPFVALEPVVLRDALDPERTPMERLPSGYVLHARAPVFREEAITADIFWLDLPHIFSYVYVTEGFVRCATDHGLTGAVFECVYEDGVGLCPDGYVKYPDGSGPPTRNFFAEMHLLHARGQEDDALLEYRYFIARALREGWIRT